ncbi:nickel-binding protein [Microvirga flavescens]|uniref:nickel-binding protein n=1 Tax=Microvirga flavescens TaxID=2249811 RepID=UPI000DD550FE|nr:nickel-binding protein [Microvirga flavescens]
MPLFLDRHDMKGTSATEVAEAHLKDLSIQDGYGVKFLTYWFDEERGTAFCLIDAPDQETAQRVHHDAHGHVAGEVIQVALSAVEAFLGRISDPQSSHPSETVMPEPGHRSIMFTDIVESTEMTARLGDVASTELVRAHDALIRRALARHDGREVKHLGDGIMASFESTVAAVECAKAIQSSFERYNRASAEPIHVRIGLDCGEPVEDSHDLFGSTVQCASRMCSAAGSDQILVTARIRDECGNGYDFVDLGLKNLKGFHQPVQAFEYEWRADVSG